MGIKFAKLNDLGFSKEGLKIAKRYGGKPLAWAEKLLEGTGVKIPKSTYIRPGILTRDTDERNRLLAEVPFEKGVSKFARACVVADPITGHPGDIGQGTVIDFFPSRPISNTQGLLDYVDQLTRLTRVVPSKNGIYYFDNPNLARNHYAYEGGNPEQLGSKVGVLVEDLVRSKPRWFDKGYQELCGSILEHPANPDVYIVEIGDNANPENRHSTATYDFSLGKLQLLHGSIEEVPEMTIIKLINGFRRIRDSGFLPNNRSLHMEFGLNQNLSNPSSGDDPVLLQVKQFRPKYKPEPWSLDDQPGTTKPYTAFGTTPEEGIVVQIHDQYSREVYTAFTYNGLAKGSKARSRPDLTFMPKEEMKIAIFSGSDGGATNHGGHWTLANASDLGVYYPRSRFENGKEIKIKSNGIQAQFERV